MAGRKKVLNMNDPNDLETIKNLLLYESNDDEDIVLDESDTMKKSMFQKDKGIQNQSWVQQVIPKMEIMTTVLQGPT